MKDTSANHREVLDSTCACAGIPGTIEMKYYEEREHSAERTLDLASRFALLQACFFSQDFGLVRSLPGQIEVFPAEMPVSSSLAVHD